MCAPQDNRNNQEDERSRQERVCFQKYMLKILVSPVWCTLARTQFISGLKSQVLKLVFFWLKNDVLKWSRIFYFKIQWALLELLLPSVKGFAQKG